MKLRSSNCSRTDWRLLKKGALITSLPNTNGKRVYLPAGKDVLVDKLVGFPQPVAKSQLFAQDHSGPNPVYYHTEGNPPGFGKNDNGTIASGKYSQFTTTAATFYAPEVYLTSSYGETNCTVLFGPVSQQTISIYSTNDF